jgi:hypothetical protein
VLLRFQDDKLGAIAGGVILGLLTLMRPASLLLAPLIFLCRPQPLKIAFVRTVALSAIALGVVLPWTVRNCVRMDGCALVSTNGGWNLAIGAITETGRFQTLHGSDGCPNVTGQVQQDDCWAKVGWKTIKAAPLHWLGLAPKKLAQTFDHESFAIGYLHEADPASWPEDRREAARNLLTAAHLALLVAAALSVVSRPFALTRREQLWQGSLLGLTIILSLYGLSRDEHPFHWLMVVAPLAAALPLPGRPDLGALGRMAFATIAITAVTHVVFFGEDRYHLFLSPLLCILAAAALRRAGAATRQQPLA